MQGGRSPNSFLRLLPLVLTVFVLAALVPMTLFHALDVYPKPDTVDSEDGSALTLQDDRGTTGTQGRACSCGASLEASVLVILSKPWRYFSSAHWFHISEYYLPHHTTVRPFLRTNQTVFVQAPNAQFLRELTKVTFFLLILAFTNGAPNRVEVITPDAVSFDPHNSGIAHIQPGKHNNFVFDATLPVLGRFYRVNASAMPAVPPSVTALLATSDTPGSPLTISAASPAGSNLTSNSTPKAPAASLATGVVGTCTCARVVGEFGGAPIERGYWFGSAEGVNSTRERIQRLCSSSPQQAPSTPGGFSPRLVQEEGSQAVSPGGQSLMQQLWTWAFPKPQEDYVSPPDMDDPASGLEEPDTKGGLEAANAPAATTFVPGGNRAAASRGTVGGEDRGTTGVGAAGPAVMNQGLAARFTAGKESTGREGGRSVVATVDEDDLEGAEAAVFSIDGSMKPKPRKAQHRLVIYQRDSNRRLLDEDTIVRTLKKRLGRTWEIAVIIHSEEHHPCVLWAHLRSADLLLTPHGFQSILLILMPRGSAIFEVFPYKYWKDGYRPLANEYGLWHGWSQNHHATEWWRNAALSLISQDQCMLRLDCREYARQDDVYLDEASTKAIILLARHVVQHKTKRRPSPKHARRRSIVGLSSPTAGAAQEHAIDGDRQPPTTLVRRPALRRVGGNGPSGDGSPPQGELDRALERSGEFTLSADVNLTDDPAMWTVSPPILTPFR